MSAPLPPGELESTTDLVAFEVEGSGYYLVPLDALASYEIATTPSGTSVALGWGWSLPVVRWNTFHPTQIGIGISLAPNVVALLAAHHFVASITSPSITSSAITHATPSHATPSQATPSQATPSQGASS